MGAGTNAIPIREKDDETSRPGTVPRLQATSPHWRESGSIRPRGPGSESIGLITLVATSPYAAAGGWMGGPSSNSASWPEPVSERRMATNHIAPIRLKSRQTTKVQAPAPGHHRSSSHW